MKHSINLSKERLRNVKFEWSDGAHYGFSCEWRYNKDRDDEWFSGKISMAGGVKEKSSKIFYLNGHGEVSLDYDVWHRTGRYYGDLCDVSGIVYLDSSVESDVIVSGTCEWQDKPED